MSERKEAYVEEYEAKLEELKAKMKEKKAGAASATADAKGKMSENFENARNYLSELKSNTGEGWDELKLKASAALEALKNQF